MLIFIYALILCLLLYECYIHELGNWLFLVWEYAHFSHTVDAKESLYLHCLSVHAIGEGENTVSPTLFFQTTSCKTGDIWRAKLLQEHIQTPGSADHRHFGETELCLKSGQLSHWCKHTSSVWMCVSELHDYRFWQFAWFECSMSAKLCTNLGGQKPTVLGTQFPISSSANKVHSRTHARALVCMPDSTNSSFLLCHLGNTWHIAKSGQVMFQCIRELARLQPGFWFFLFFCKGTMND